MSIIKSNNANQTSEKTAATTFTVNFGKRASDNMPEAVDLTWQQLTERFSKPDLTRGKLPYADYQALKKEVEAEAKLRKEEKDGHYFVMAAFTGNEVRNDENVLYMTGFVGDIDTGLVSKEELQAALSGFTYLAYSSYSHSAEHPTWRFILLYSKPTTVAVHKKVFAILQRCLSGNLDGRCETPAQLWYTPACPPDAAEKFEFFIGTGAPFDTAATAMIQSAASIQADMLPLQQTPKIAKAANTCTSEHAKQQLPIALSFISADDRDSWIKAGMAIKNALGDDGFETWDTWSQTSFKYDADDAASTWDSLHPQGEGGVTLGTVFHLAKEGGYIPSNSTAAAPASMDESGEIQPLFNINDARVDRFLKHPAPPRRWLLHNTLPHGKVGMLVAPGGTGKSFLMIQLAVSIATNTPLAGHWKVGTLGACLILCAEEDDDDLHHRLRDVLEGTTVRSSETEKLIAQRIFIKSMLTMDNLMTSANGNGEVVLTNYVDRLIKTAQQITDLKLIVIDPASRFRGGNENAASDTTRFVEALERLRSATGATVLLVHHTNKGSMNAEEATQGASRGSSALTDGVRWQMSLTKPTTKQATAAGISTHNLQHYVLATITKNNGAPPQDPVFLLRGPGGVLEAVLKAAPRMSPEASLIGLILSEAAAKRTHTGNSLEKRFSGTNGPLKLSAVALRGLITTCIQLKYLRKRTIKPMNVLELTGTMPP